MLIFISGPDVSWILFGVALAVILGLIIFGLVMCRRHGSARKFVCPSAQNKASKPPESVHCPGPDVETETVNDRADGLHYESIRDAVGRTLSWGLGTVEISLIKLYLQYDLSYIKICKSNIAITMDIKFVDRRSYSITDRTI